MKKFCIVLAAVAIATATLVPAARALEVSGDAYIGAFDKYLWRGMDLSGSQPVVQGGVDLSAQGVTLSYWSNIQTSSDEGLEGGDVTETDIVLDYSFDANELLSVSVGNIFYALDGLDDTNELYLGLGLNTILEPSLTIFYDYDEADETGLFYQLAIGHSLDLTEQLSVSAGALVSYNQESDYAVGDYNAFHNYELSLGADYAVNDLLVISPTVLFSDALSNDAEDLAAVPVKDEILVGVTATVAF